MRQIPAMTLATTLRTRLLVWLAVGGILTGLSTTIGLAQKPKEKAKPKTEVEKSAKAEGENDLGDGVIRINDITSRYHFVEKYNPKATQSSTNQIGQYRVASKFTIKTAIDRPEGAPERTEGTTQVIYTERPAVLSVNGQVLKLSCLAVWD